MMTDDNKPHFVPRGELSFDDLLRINETLDAFVRDPLPDPIELGLIMRDGLILGSELTDPSALFALPEGVTLEFRRPEPIVPVNDEIDAALFRLICGNGTTTGDPETVEQRERRQARNKAKRERRARRGK